MVPRHSVKRLVFMTPPISAIELSAVLPMPIAAAIQRKLGTRCLREISFGNGCPIFEPHHLGFSLRGLEISLTQMVVHAAAPGLEGKRSVLGRIPGEVGKGSGVAVK